ncbi:MAG TPA: adenosylmethionine decarboxylase [Planctomycetota bacterium]|jgi:S-adenosylmethionine decarboxylase proenzyme
MDTTSTHLICEFSGCNREALSSVMAIKNAMYAAARESNATVLHGYFHQFTPSGVSGVLGLAESHISIHTWPEADYAAIDIFTCGHTATPIKGISYLKGALHARDVKITDITRGIPLPDGTFTCRIHSNQTVKPHESAEVAAVIKA